jgi:hypothetical protein
MSVIPIGINISISTSTPKSWPPLPNIPNTPVTSAPGIPVVGTVELTAYSCYKSGFDSILSVNFSIHNTNAFDVKDIVVYCSGFAPSGTHIDDNERTIYQVVKAGQTKRINGFDMGFLLSQVRNV